MQSMFNWFYWAINIGALSLIATTNIEKYLSFWLAYLVPTVVFVGTIAVLIIGRNKYVQKPPAGSLMVRAIRVVIASIRIRWKLGKQPDRANLLDYAKETPVSDKPDENEIIEIENKNKFIDDLKQALKACRVFLFYPFYWICYNQFGTNLVSQAAQMNVGEFIICLRITIVLKIFPKLLFRSVTQ